MDVAYWNRIASDYDDLVFNSATAGSTDILQRRFAEIAAPDRVACDFGCGVGHYLPMLSAGFRRVIAIDFAAELLEQARSRYARLGNIEFLQADLARGRRALPRAHVGLCTNVLIHPDPKIRRAILRRVHTQLMRGGALMAVLPSTESMLYAGMRLSEWRQRGGTRESDAVRTERRAMARSANDLVRGVLLAGGERTKCYLREEAEVLFEEAGFRMRSADKLEFAWSQEIENPPAWLGGPLPWDWLFVVQKRSV
jgi:SAM-dependent methyltransferase